jgi:2-polyprenyl-6-methoxyphenol hydroxylase-like FAD-dependent oxidoreductase
MPDVLISGASVAGPCLAYWLHRYGFRVTVVERAPALRGGGYAVDFRGPVHLTVLERMGVLDRIRARQTHLSSLTHVDSDGRPVTRMPPELFAGDVEILRGDLAEILYGATRQDVEYVFGDSITVLDQGSDGVRVEFERGPGRTFDLVFGADGLHSAVRRLAFPAAPPHELGFYVCIFATTNLAGDRAGLLHSVPGRTASVYSAHGGADGIAMLVLASPPIEYDHRDVAGQKAIVAGAFASDGWLVPELLRQLESTADFYFDSVSQVRLDRWSTGRIALLGDAGYAAGPGGNGTGTAVVAAYVLAGELARAGGDHALAFDRYERQLRSYVEGGQKQAAGGKDFLVPATWRKIRQRDRFFRMLPYLPGMKGLFRRLSTRTTTALTLPCYDLAQL